MATTHRWSIRDDAYACALAVKAGRITQAEAHQQLHDLLDPEYCRENPNGSWDWVGQLLADALQE